MFKEPSNRQRNFHSSTIINQLYPDQEAYKKEEQRRFEILDAHWDLPMTVAIPRDKVIVIMASTHR